MHGLRRKLSHFFFQAALVKSPDLLQEDDGVLGKAAAVGIQLDVSGELCLVPLAGDGGGDDGGAVAIAHIVLDDEDGTDAALLRAYHGAQVGVVDFSSFDGHGEDSFQGWLLHSILRRSSG